MNMVLTRDSQLGPKFPSRVISLVAEKFSPVKDSRNLNKKDTKRTGRRMVAEELKFRRVDVKERQQRFESMADMKDSRPSRKTRCQSTEIPSKHVVSPARRARSISAEPDNCSNVFKQAKKLATAPNNEERNERLKKSLDRRNSVNVGKVADKFERRSEDTQAPPPPKRSGQNFSPSALKSRFERSREGIQKAARNKESSVPSVRGNGQATEPEVERSGFEKAKEANNRTFGTGECNPGSKEDQSGLEKTRESIHVKNGREPSFEAQGRQSVPGGQNLKEKVRTWEGREEGQELPSNSDYQKRITDTNNSTRNGSYQNYGTKQREPIEGQSQIEKDADAEEDAFNMTKVVSDTKKEFMKRNIEIIATSRRKSVSNSEDLNGKGISDVKEDVSRHQTDASMPDVEKRRVVKNDKEPQLERQSWQNGLETIDDAEVRKEKQFSVANDENIISARKTDETGKSQCSEQPGSKPLERTPSMKILVLNKEPKSPGSNRSTAIVRVNSKAKDNGGPKPRILQNERRLQGSNQETKMTSRNARLGSQEKTPNRGKSFDDDLEAEQSQDWGVSRSSDFEARSSYYRDVRHELRGHRGLSPEKQRLLSTLLSLENKEIAKSLGLSDELIELLREEEGFWKRQVELKKWRELQETKGRDGGTDCKIFDLAKERKIAELRRQQSLRQLEKTNVEDEGLSIEELRIAEERLLAQEASELLRLAGTVRNVRNVGDTSTGSLIADDGNAVDPGDRKIYLKQHSVGSGVSSLNSNTPKRDKRYSYPSQMTNALGTNVGIDGTSRVPQIRSYDHWPRSPQQVSVEPRRLPSLTTISNGPLTYFEHIANEERKKLAKPYSPHPRKKSGEYFNFTHAQRIQEVEVVDLSVAEKYKYRRYNSHDSVFDSPKEIGSIGTDSDRHRNGRLADVNQSHGSDVRDSFSPRMEGDGNHSTPKNCSPEHENAFDSLKRQNDCTDPSYLSLINSRSVPHDLHKEEGRLKDGIDSDIPTYHVTSVAVRYARAGPSSETKLDSREDQSHELTSESEVGNHSESIGEKTGLSKKNIYSSRAFSENDSMFTENNNRQRFLSGEVTRTEELREARLIVGKGSVKPRCSTCQRLIYEKAMMTVDYTEMCWHNTCFYCVVCGIMLVKTRKGSCTQVRLIDDELHCITCFSQNGGQLSEV